MVRTSMQDLRLRRYHDLEGAIFRPEAGWLIPATYGPVDAEVRAVRSRAGMIDWSDRAKIRLTGSERVTFLDGIVTADMKILTPGGSAYALLLNEKSRVLGDLRVYAFADSLVLDIEASQKDTVMAILEKARVSDDVEFHDLGACGHIEVHGPASGDLTTSVLPVDARGLPQDAFLTFAVDKHHEGHVGRVRGPGAPQAVRAASRRRRPAGPRRQGLEGDPRDRQGHERYLVPDDRLGDRDRASPPRGGLRERYPLDRPRRLGPPRPDSPAAV